MALTLTADQTEAQLAISDDDGRPYHYEVSGADVRIGTNRRRMEDYGTMLRAGDSGPIQTPNGTELFAELVGDGPATLALVPNLRVERDPRREIERPTDAAVRAGQSEIVNNTGTGLLSGSSSKEWTLADNTDPGVYRLQTVNVTETSGAWSPDIRVEIRIKDDTGTVTERIAANIAQLPYLFPFPVSVPENFTATAVVHNDSASSIDYRLNAAYTMEVL